MVKFLEGQGWVVLRISGSHHVMEGGGKRTVVPVHGNQTMKIGTLRSILRDAELATDQFSQLWHRR
jgi:predicted RNA binding protein YcfA (HicA-like mRNA interferase family)